MASDEITQELYCSICLSIYIDPVMLRCGHHFCRGCITKALDYQKASGMYTCPECRKRTRTRPVLQKILKLSNIAECVHNAQSKQEESGIFCTYCDHNIPAAKTCLNCEVFFCEKHLVKHNKAVDHVLLEATASVQQRWCSDHKEILGYYCIEDASCICAACCIVGEHQGHRVEQLNVAFEKKKQDIVSKREKIEKRLQSLQTREREVKEKADGKTERVTALYRNIREQLDVQEKRVLSEITRQKEHIAAIISNLIQQLEIKKDKLSRMEELSNMTDPLTVLQGEKTENAELCDTEEENNGNHLDEVLISVTLQDSLHNMVNIISDQNVSDLLLDVNTAASNVVVSGDLKMASFTDNKQQCPYRAERFSLPQVFSINNFSSGQHYWEVETSDLGYKRVGVAYASIDRCLFIGNDSRSWSYAWSGKCYSGKMSAVKNKMGIYLDYEAGRLSFYLLSDQIRHLETFNATFTEPLHAVFYVDSNSWIRIRK